jgi:hypothetical protein
VIGAAASGAARACVGVCVRALPGEQACGDACESIAWNRGHVVVLADGLGHGEHAAVASRAFVACVRENAEVAFDELFARAHRSLQRTRGVVAAVARFDDERGEVEIAGVGNVAVLLSRAALRKPEHVLGMPGVVGGTYRSPRVHAGRFDHGDVLVMCSDGVRARFDLELLRSMPVQSAAEAVLRAHAVPDDDAACAVVRRIVDAGARHQSLGRIPIAESDPEPPTDRTIAIDSGAPLDRVAPIVRDFARAAGLSARAQWEVGIAACEIAVCLGRAGRGELRLSFARDAGVSVVLEAIGEREAVALAMEAGALRRLMDDVSADGERIVARKHRASTAR